MKGDAHTPARFWSRAVAHSYKEAAEFEEAGWVPDNSCNAITEEQEEQ